ncbi:hypothetical protein [Bradyrhizobium uaiense]|uniref:hypothetical protein n=1 Tax=Bradyrhizobium uaiense TaxID=2594946 RepID=UPI0013D05CA9|nr:hypothetical protein [Bradyrhizobium uaiense]
MFKFISEGGVMGEVPGDPQQSVNIALGLAAAVSALLRGKAARAGRFSERRHAENVLTMAAYA